MLAFLAGTVFFSRPFFCVACPVSAWLGRLTATIVACGSCLSARAMSTSRPPQGMSLFAPSMETPIRINFFFSVVVYSCLAPNSVLSLPKPAFPDPDSGVAALHLSPRSCCFQPGHCQIRCLSCRAAPFCTAPAKRGEHYPQSGKIPRSKNNATRLL